MIAKDKPSTPAQRSRLRFSLKSLFFLMLLVASFFAGRASMMTRLRDAELARDAALVAAEQQRYAALVAEANRALAEATVLQAAEQ